MCETIIKRSAVFYTCIPHKNILSLKPFLTFMFGIFVSKFLVTLIMNEDLCQY